MTEDELNAQMRDDDLRKLALEEATIYHKGDGGGDPAKVAKTARDFYDFLKGW